jgi:NhaA family Na+:H+ antiporter
MPISMIRRFISHEASGGIMLIIAAICAMILHNSTFGYLYEDFLHLSIGINIGEYDLTKDFLHWINDGLMVVFFFLIGLEIKREVMIGELSTVKKSLLPLIAAIGGMAVPGIIFYFTNQTSPENIAGWAIPAATDIAFALGVLALLGKRIPLALKVFLLAVAIIDDLGAIMIIAAFYTHHLALLSLYLAIGVFLILIMLNYANVKHTGVYILFGIIMWLCVLKSGVHATLAGVLIALTIPLRAPDNSTNSLLIELEHKLHPYIAFLVLPLFAFCNAGVSLKGIQMSDFLNPLPLGIALGLFLGNQIGIFGLTWLFTKLKICHLPEGTNYKHVYGVSILCGIGFTMSLFIGSLGFEGQKEQLNLIRLGVLTGSLISGIYGYFYLMAVTRVEKAQLA